jgi:hypothetical protein
MPYSYPSAAEEMVYGLNIVITPRPIEGTENGTPAYALQGDILGQMGPVAQNAAPVPLRPGESLYSPGRAFRLTFQTDGNVVLQVVNTGEVPSDWPTMPKVGNDGVPWTPIWASNTANRGAVQLEFNDVGNMLILDGGNNILFQTNTGSYPQAFLRMQDDGNLVIYKQGGQPVWASNTSAGEAPGANVGKYGGLSESGCDGQHHLGLGDQASFLVIRCDDSEIDRLEPIRLGGHAGEQIRLGGRDEARELLSALRVQIGGEHAPEDHRSHGRPGPVVFHY